MPSSPKSSSSTVWKLAAASPREAVAKSLCSYAWSLQLTCLILESLIFCSGLTSLPRTTAPSRPPFPCLIHLTICG